MSRYVNVFLSICILICLTACNSLMNMKTVPLLSSVPPNMAIVNFVRSSHLAGAAQTRELWDEDTYIGSLSSGSMIQYVTEPGKHLFLTDNYNWGWTSIEIDLKPDREYYIRVEVFHNGFRFEELLYLDENTQSWISELEVETIDLETSKQIPNSAKSEAKAAAEREKNYIRNRE